MPGGIGVCLSSGLGWLRQLTSPCVSGVSGGEANSLDPLGDVGLSHAVNPGVLLYFDQSNEKLI